MAAIISIGEVLWDLFPEGACFGGAPANVACHAALQGANVTMISAVGKDLRGRTALRILHGYGVDTSLIQRADSATGTVGVSVDAAGKPTFEIHQNSAWDNLTWDATWAERIAAADAIYFGTLGQRSPQARETIRRGLQVAESAGIPRILDVNLRAPFYDAAMIRESMALATILKLSDDELPTVLKACGVGIEQLDLDLVVMTRGAKGAALFRDGLIMEQAGISVDVQDTVGAGDAFTAAFILGHLAGAAPAANLQHACQVAAAACTHAGAVPTR